VTAVTTAVEGSAGDVRCTGISHDSGRRVPYGAGALPPPGRSSPPAGRSFPADESGPVDPQPDLANIRIQRPSPLSGFLNFSHPAAADGLMMSRMHFFSQRSPAPNLSGDNPQSKLQALEHLLQSMSEGPAVTGNVRLLVEDLPATGPRNMAVDEALLESVAAGGPATLRLYRWSDATISIGYFQRETPEIDPGGRFYGLPVVRRLSGGGAILHHREVTYSCCIPASHPLAAEPAHLYEEIHGRIQATLAEFGARVEPRGESEGSDKPFLCFARGDRRDLVSEGFKVVGSAQRRRRGAILQHGSILLRRSPFLPEFPGLLDLARVQADESELMERLAHHAGLVLGDAPHRGELTSIEAAAADHLERERYWELMPQAVTELP
jgi:lipoate-protein ligase A